MLSDWRKWPFSAYALLLANLYPVYGIGFLSWDPKEVMFLYWAETGIIAFYALLGGMVAAARCRYPSRLWLFLTLLLYPVTTFFYLLLVAVFMLVHFLLLVVLVFGNGNVPLTPALAGGLLLPLALPMALLFLSHGVSFFSNYVASREYEKSNQNLAEAVLNRICLMHILSFSVFVIGGLAGEYLGLSSKAGSVYPAVLAALIVVAKTAGDLVAHMAQRAAPRPGAK